MIRAREAVEALEHSRRLFADLVAKDRNNTTRAYALVLVSNETASAILDRGNVERASQILLEYNKSMRTLVESDPENVRWWCELGTSHRKIGDVFRSKGNFDAALNAYRTSLTISDRLVNGAPENTKWLRDQALRHGYIATVAAEQGNRDAALISFEQGRAIFAKLNASSLDDPRLPKDLAWFDSQIAGLSK